MNTPSQPQDPANTLSDPNAIAQQPDPHNSLPPTSQPQPASSAEPQLSSQPQLPNSANQPAAGAEKPLATRFNGDVYEWFLKEMCHVADLSEVGDYKLMCGSDGDDDVSDARFQRVYKIHSRDYKANTGYELPTPNNTPVASIFDAYVQAHPVPAPQPVAQTAPQSVPAPQPAARLVPKPVPPPLPVAQPAPQSVPAPQSASVPADPGTQQMPASAAPAQGHATIPQAPAAPAPSTQAPAAPVQAPADPAPSIQSPAISSDPAQAPTDPAQAPTQNPAPAQLPGQISPEQMFRNFMRDFEAACHPDRLNEYTEQDLNDWHAKFQQTNSYLVRDVAHFVELNGLDMPPSAQPVQEVSNLKGLRVVLGIAVIGLAGIIYAGRKEINNFVNPSDKRPAPTATASAAPTATTKPAPQPVATTKPSAVPVAPTSVPTSTASATPTSTASATPTSTASATPTSTASAAPKPSASAPNQPEPAPQPSSTVPLQPAKFPLKAFTLLCTNRSIPENCRPADPNVIPYVNKCKFDAIQHLSAPLIIRCTDAQGYPGPVYTTKYNIQDRAAYSGTPYGENVEFTVYLYE